LKAVSSRQSTFNGHTGKLVWVTQVITDGGFLVLTTH